jgi:hypothetical protein
LYYISSVYVMSEVLGNNYSLRMCLYNKALMVHKATPIMVLYKVVQWSLITREFKLCEFSHTRSPEKERKQERRKNKKYLCVSWIDTKPWPPPNSAVGGRGRLTIGMSRVNGECSGLLFSLFILSSFRLFLCFYAIKNKITVHFTSICTLYYIHTYYRVYTKACTSLAI